MKLKHDITYGLKANIDCNREFQLDIDHFNTGSLVRVISSLFIFF